ncbi:MAG TPA: alkaline phosphatase family protein [Gaiellaceae bacterium]|nr:alkaline phosphatase family protein [Gaiellaceae bacterium]
MTGQGSPARAAAACLLAAITVVAAAGGAEAAGEPRWPLAEKVVLFAADGMRPDLVDRYAAQGSMPTMAELMAEGVKGQNGLLQGFPPNTFSTRRTTGRPPTTAPWS